MTRTSWPRPSAASLRRVVEYRLAFRDRSPIFIEAPTLPGWGVAVAAQEVRRTRVHQQVPGHGGPAEEHAEPHLVALGARELDPVPLGAEGEGRAHHRAKPDIGRASWRERGCPSVSIRVGDVF